MPDKSTDKEYKVKTIEGSIGGSFVVVELLDVNDSRFFKNFLLRKGFTDLTPNGMKATYISNKPDDGMLQKVADQDPDWWYLSGHFARTPNYEEQGKDKPLVQVHPRIVEEWNVEIDQSNPLIYGTWYRLWKKDPRGKPILLKEGMFHAFGVVSNIKRNINILNENGRLSGKGKTEIISVKPYDHADTYYDCTPTKVQVPGIGTSVDQERYYKTGLKKFKLLWNKGVGTTPYTHPEEYKVIIKSPPIERTSYEFQNQRDFPYEKVEDGGIDLIFINPRPYYVVTFDANPSNKYIEDYEKNTGAKWENENPIAYLRKYITAYHMHDVHIKLEDKWEKKYKYTTVEHHNDAIFYVTTSHAMYEVEENEDIIKVKLIKRVIDTSKDASFFNKSYYDNEYQSKGTSGNSWKILMEYSLNRSELKDHNFFEKLGLGTYSSAKIVFLISCNTLTYPSVRKYLSELFPNALFLGHIHKNPSNSTPIVKNFLETYFSDISKKDDKDHIITSWLSYYDKSKNSMMKRGYGLAVCEGGNVYGIGVDSTYPTVLAENGQMIQRLRLKSVEKKGTLVDSLIVWNEDGGVLDHKFKYHGEETVNSIDTNIDPFKDTNTFPFLSLSNLQKNRGY